MLLFRLNTFSRAPLFQLYKINLDVYVFTNTRRHFDPEGVQFLSDDFLYSAKKSLSNWMINSNF